MDSKNETKNDLETNTTKHNILNLIAQKSSKTGFQQTSPNQYEYNSRPPHVLQAAPTVSLGATEELNGPTRCQNGGTRHPKSQFVTKNDYHFLLRK